MDFSIEAVEIPFSRYGTSFSISFQFLHLHLCFPVGYQPPCIFVILWASMCIYSLHTSAGKPDNMPSPRNEEWNCPSLQAGCAVTLITHWQFSASTACLVTCPFVSLPESQCRSSPLQCDSYWSLSYCIFSVVYPLAQSMSLEFSFFLCVLTITSLSNAWTYIPAFVSNSYDFTHVSSLV